MHTYFVSFHHGSGFGSCAVTTNGPVTSWEGTNALREAVFASPEMPWGVRRENLVVLNFVLLSGPEEAQR